MSKVIEYWCDSGANSQSCVKGSITLEELELSEDEWNNLSDDERDEVMRPIACDRLDWGYRLQEEDEDQE